MASRALNRIRDFNHSPSRWRRGQEHDCNHDQHSERTARERQRTDHVERPSKEESSGKQKRSKSKGKDHFSSDGQVTFAIRRDSKQ